VEIVESRQQEGRLLGTTGRYTYRGLRRGHTGYSIGRYRTSVIMPSLVSVALQPEKEKDHHVVPAQSGHSNNLLQQQGQLLS
jgi:hypothetical protein